jgi:hypothetical protein
MHQRCSIGHAVIGWHATALNSVCDVTGIVLAPKLVSTINRPTKAEMTWTTISTNDSAEMVFAGELMRFRVHALCTTTVKLLSNRAKTSNPSWARHKTYVIENANALQCP